MPDTAPRVLQIYRDTVLPGSEAMYRSIEEEAARICVEMRCPHPHLAIQAIDSPSEVWWLNAYDSDVQVQEVASAYQANEQLVAALADVARRKKPITGDPVNEFIRHRPDLSAGPAWTLALAQVMVIAVTLEERRLPGSVFEAVDGRRFALQATTSLDDAESKCRVGGMPSRIFAVRPYWGMPRQDWIAAAPAFWSVNPAAAPSRR